MFLSVSESKGGVRVWFNAALKLLYASTVPVVPGTTDVLPEPDYEQAKAALDIVIQGRPRWAEPYYYRGLAFAGMSKDIWSNPLTGKALADFDQALQLDSSMSDVYWARATLLAKHKPQQAIADLSSLLSLEPTVAAHLKRAELSLVVGNKAAAVRDYRQALERYIVYCNGPTREQIKAYQSRVTLELQQGNLQGVLTSLMTFWEQHAFMSYQ